MAYSHGIANGHADLWAKLKAFLTTHPDLVAANQNWEIIWDASGVANPENPTDILLRGPGLAGQDQVYVGMRAVTQTANDRHWFEMRGSTGPLSSARTYYDHIRTTPEMTRIFTDLGTMEYWMIANGRRFAMVLKISTVFQSMYAGLFLPYATPDAYPYPLYIGGNAGPTGQSQSVSSWRTEGTYHTSYVYPNWSNTSQNVDSMAWMINPSGEWIAGKNGLYQNPAYSPGDHWGGNVESNSYYNPRAIHSLMLDALGGGRLLTPITLLRNDPSQTYGILDGIFVVSGVANAAENIIQHDGVDHLVVQNTFRTTFYDYFAMALE